MCLPSHNLGKAFVVFPKCWMHSEIPEVLPPVTVRSFYTSSAHLWTVNVFSFSYLVMFLPHCNPVSLFLSLLEHQIRHKGVFQDGGKHEQKAHHKKPFQGLNVRNLKRTIKTFNSFTPHDQEISDILLTTSYWKRVMAFKAKNFSVTANKNIQNWFQLFLKVSD